MLVGVPGIEPRRNPYKRLMLTFTSYSQTSQPSERVVEDILAEIILNVKPLSWVLAKLGCPDMFNFAV